MRIKCEEEEQSDFLQHAHAQRKIGGGSLHGANPGVSLYYSQPRVLLEAARFCTAQMAGPAADSDPFRFRIHMVGGDGLIRPSWKLEKQQQPII
jgi:hypothetical protein